MVVLIRCNDIVSDPRAMKYIRFMEEEGIEHIRIAWDREGNAPERSDTIYYKRKSGYNVGGFKAARNKQGWMHFVLKTLKKMSYSNLTLHCCDLDAVFPAVIYKLLFNREVTIIFDVFDWYSATLYNQNKVLLTVFKLMERLSVKYSDYFIICEPERIEQIPYIIDKNKISVLPNIPYFNEDEFLKIEEKFLFDNELITFAYVGGFSSERCLKEVIEIANEGLINLLIAGYGNSEIENILNLNQNDKHIRYFGKVNYKDGLKIMFNADIVYAMYSICNPNHIYAAPNKFYETMMIGKPLFTTKGTIVERKVLELKIGYVSGESKKDIKSIISNLSKNDMILKGETAHQLWINKYKSYTDNYMRYNYVKMIN